MDRKYILGLDPSGNFFEGKGTTGWVLLSVDNGKIVDIGSISARDYGTQQAYWNAHIDLINKHMSLGIVLSVEDYLVYSSKSRSQINSKMETPQLIGVLKMWCYLKSIPMYMRPAVAAKKRWTDQILQHKGYIRAGARSGVWLCALDYGPRRLVSHELDAIRHAVHCKEFELGKVEPTV